MSAGEALQGLVELSRRVECLCYPKKMLAMPVTTFPVLGGGATIVWNSCSLVNLLVGDSFFLEDLRNFRSRPPPRNLKAFAFLPKAFTAFLWRVRITSITDPLILCFAALLCY